MIGSWFGRLFGRAPAAAAPPASSPPVRQRATAATSAAVMAAGVVAPAVGAHRALISARGQIAGFQFRIADALLQRQAGRADAALARAGAATLLSAMRQCAQGGKVALCELPAAWLPLADASTLQARMHIALTGELPEAADSVAQQLARWRQGGAAIGWRDGAAPAALAGERPDFLLLPAAEDPAALMQSLRSALARHRGVPLLAPDLPDLDVLEAMLQAGISYAGCRVDGTREPREAQALPPQTQQLMRLLARLAADADSAEIVAAIKADVGLSYRLLRQMNSAAMAGGNELGSIEQAVAMLGRKALYSSVSALLVRQAPHGPAAQALQAMTLARARLFELLAGLSATTPAGALFTLGLASMLPRLLRTPMADALAALTLHPQAQAALLGRQGPWAVWLELAEVLDEGDMVQAEALAAPFGGLAAVTAAVAKSWLYAGHAVDGND